MKCIAKVAAMAIVLLSLSGSLNNAAFSADDSVEALKKKLQMLEAENQKLKQRAYVKTSTKSKADAQACASYRGPFKDIAGNFAESYIEDLRQLGVFDGVGPLFKPDQPISRAEYVAWVLRAYNAIHKSDDQIRMVSGGGQTFSDVPSTHWAYPYCQSMARAGYSIGYEDGTFKPDNQISREEMIAIKVGVDDGKTYKPSRYLLKDWWKFSDTDRVDERYSGYVAQDLFDENIQRAFGKIGTFRPKEPVLRGEAAATVWMYRYKSETARAALKRKQVASN